MDDIFTNGTTLSPVAPSAAKTAYQVNEILTTIAGSLSMFGTSMIFVTYLAWRDLRTPSRKILVFISIGDFLTAFVNVSGFWISSNLSQNGNNHMLFKYLCKTEGALNIAAILSSFFWTVYLSVYLYASICRGLTSASERKLMLVFHLTAWGIPLLIACLAVGLKAVGHTGAVSMSKDFVSDGWCWIDTGKSSMSYKALLAWMFFAGKGWELLAYVAITVFYVKVKWYLKREVYSHRNGAPFITLGSLDAARKADRKFTFIPIIFIVLRLWGTVRFFQYVSCLPVCQAKGPPQTDWLKIMHGIGDSSQGFANFIIFCVFTQKIRLKFSYWCSRLFPCCPGPREEPTPIGYESTNVLTDQSYEG